MFDPTLLDRWAHPDRIRALALLRTPPEDLPGRTVPMDRAAIAALLCTPARVSHRRPRRRWLRRSRRR